MNQIYREFIKQFGNWSCSKSCRIKNLPFVSDIEKFFDELENRNLFCNERQELKQQIREQQRTIRELRRQISVLNKQW